MRYAGGTEHLVVEVHGVGEEELCVEPGALRARLSEPGDAHVEQLPHRGHRSGVRRLDQLGVPGEIPAGPVRSGLSAAKPSRAHFPM